MGLIVGFSGVDGSGKTTTAKRVAEKLKALGYNVTYHHEIDFIVLKPLFNFFSRFVGSGRAESSKEKIISKTERGIAIYSDVYYIVILIDSLISFVYFKLKRGIVLHDRWVYDFNTFFDHKNYHNRLIRWLFTVFPRADVMILLTVPPEVAQERKKNEEAHEHHDLSYYKTMCDQMLELAKKFKYDCIIESNRPTEEIADEIIEKIKKYTKK